MSNEVYLLNFNEFDDKIVLEGLWTHEEEISNMSACPYDANLLITSYATGTGEYRNSLFNLGILNEDVVHSQDKTSTENDYEEDESKNYH
jgi:hypothetical protein